jgi:hypothetical protein
LPIRGGGQWIILFYEAKYFFEIEGQGTMCFWKLNISYGIVGG